MSKLGEALSFCVILGGYAWWHGWFAGTPPKPATSHVETAKPVQMVNVASRRLSSRAASFKIQSRGFEPFKKPCDPYNYDGKDVTEISCTHGDITYYFTPDETRVWRLSRLESLPETMSFSSVVQQIQDRYGREPAGICILSYEADQIRYSVSIYGECTETARYMNGPMVQYDLVDEKEFDKLKSLQSQLDEAKRQKDLSTHHF